MLERREYSPSSSLDQFPTNMIQKKKSKNKRRFSDEQIKSLESIFESESKLEPIKKLELAKELGLQPRQVAIWFQNRRARWKSKQLERDYSILKANYDNLATRLESLKKEKQSLVIQLKKLNDQIGNPRENSTDEGDSENGDDMDEFNRKLNKLLSDGSELRVISSSNNGNSENNEYFRHGHEDESELMNMVEPVDGVLTSPENWCSFESSGLFDQPCSSSSPQWWDYWS